MVTFKAVYRGACPMSKRFWGINFLGPVFSPQISLPNGRLICNKKPALNPVQFWIKGCLNVKVYFCDPEKDTMYRIASDDIFCIGIGEDALCANGLKNSKINSWANKLMHKLVHVWKWNPKSDLHKILQGGRCPRHNHLCNFWWRSVKGFGRWLIELTSYIPLDKESVTLQMFFRANVLDWYWRNY